MTTYAPIPNLLDNGKQVYVGFIPSASGTTIPSAASITDSVGDVWKLVPSTTHGNQVSLNGVVDTTMSNVILVLYYNNSIYLEV